MFITDNEGKSIEITDLDKAIEQAESFTAFMHEDETFRALDKKLTIYWTDILEKLRKLQLKHTSY
jgi:hypothetical protein